MTSRRRSVSALGRTLAAVLCLMFSLAHAIDPMPFRNAGEERRFNALLAELRCMVCQNQSLADSDAGLARDLRNEVFQLMRDNKSDTEIREFLVSRYGDFVLYRPPVKGATLALWFGPVFVLGAGAFVLASTLRRRSRALARSTQLPNASSTGEKV